MTDSLQAPLRAKILSSEPVAPQEVRNILVECLTQNPPYVHIEVDQSFSP